MTKNEARLSIMSTVAGVLLSLYEEPSLDDEEGVMEVAEMLVDALDMKVLSVSEDIVTVTLDLSVDQ